MEELAEKLKKIWQVVLVLEEILIIFILVSFLYSLFSFQKTENIYFSISFQYFKENPWYLLIFIILSFLLLSVRSFLLQGSLQKFGQDVSWHRALKILLQVDFRRAVSPIGTFSAISLLDPHKDPIKGGKVFLYNQLMVTSSDWIFYVFLLSILWKSFLPVLFTALFLFPIAIFWQPGKLDFRNWLFAFLAKFPRFLLFFLVFQSFGLNLLFKQIAYIFIAWDFSAAIIPFFYGTGISELIATIVAFFVNVPFQLTLIPLFITRFFTTYFPLILLLFFKNKSTISNQFYNPS